MASLPKGAPEPEQSADPPGQSANIDREATALLTPAPYSSSTGDADAPTVVDSTPDPSANPSDAVTMIEAGTPRSPVPFPAHSDQPTLPPGTLLGQRYEIVALLGEGGMGAVYKAMDRELNRLVALKVIRPELARNKGIIDRFKQELLLAREVTHRNVIRIFDLGEADRIKFITMEYVEGEDLRALLLKKNKLSPEEAVDIIQQVCRALDAAHSVGIIHRDLKPQNIMRDKTGRILVMDFGLARTVDGEGMTQTGMLVGTMDYMSPEQALGQNLDQRSDIYTLGLIFYELLMGKRPFAGDTAIASLIRRTQERVAPITDKTIPSSVTAIISKCLDKNVAQRYPSTRELLADLEAWQGKRGAAISFAAVGSWARRSWPWFGLLCTVVVLALAVVGGMMWRGRLTKSTSVVSKPITVLVADFTNHTGDPVFDGTLEPMFNVALEDASFINAFNRGKARKLAQKLPTPAERLDEQPARLVALSQGVSSVIAGEISLRDNRYNISAIAMDAATGNILAKAEVTAETKDQVVAIIPKLVAPIRHALGDSTPESIQLERAGGAFTAASLEVVHQYGIAMEQQFAGNMQDALQSFSKAAELDPNFARAYSGMAAAYGNLGQRQEAQKSAKLALEHIDRMTERERYRIRGMYYIRSENWQKCVEEYSNLLQQYPADNIGQNNLAGCYASLHNMPKALEEARRAVQLAPKDLMAQVNFSLDACYAGDFETCAQQGREIQKLNPLYEEGYLVLAYAQLGQEQLPQASETYQKLEKLGARGASLAASGRANLAVYQGKYPEAVQILDKAIAADVAAKAPDQAADNLAILAYAELSRGEKQAAIAAAEKALAQSQSAKITFLAARIFIQAGDTTKARKLATVLGAKLQAEPQAYGKLIEAEAALQEHHSQQALELLTEAKKLADIWIVHFDLGLVYLEAGAFVEADSEFDQCLKRRGELLELFTDDMPTYSYLPPVYYYQGRVRENLKSPGYAESYRTYLSIRGQAGEDPLLAEIHQRLGQ